MCTLCYLRCATVLEPPKEHDNIEIYCSVRKESDEISLFQEGPCETAKRVPMVF